MNVSEINESVERKRKFFLSGRSRDLYFRREQLSNLKDLLAKYENEFYDALNQDLGRSVSESFFGEFLMLNNELDAAIKNLRRWSAPQKVASPIAQFPSKSYIMPEPYGVALIISPWNYPLSLPLIPAISAIAAGNCVYLKLSEHSPHTSELLKKAIGDYFDSSFMEAVVEDADFSENLLKNKFDYIFYTGNPIVARSVMKAASEHLTPVTLELGGKSPCILHEVKNIQSALKRITWGKFFNAGQTCVAVDYLLVQEKQKEQTIDLLKSTLSQFYGENPAESENYCKIVNEHHFDRLLKLLETAKIVHGGSSNRESLYIEPTIIECEPETSPIMQEEIFGPILPILSYNSIADAVDIIRAKPRPLATYLFSEDADVIQNVTTSISSGGFCINDTVVHITSLTMPFGGVGNSGMGAYHGKYGFDTFSHKKSVMHRSLGMDVPFRYPPYKNLTGWIKKLLNRFS